MLVVVTGEFGRTPRISYAKDSASGVTQPGRDHWPRAVSLLLSGGGIAGGQVIGATDRHGADVTRRRVGVRDFLATIYHHLGIDAANSILSRTGPAGQSPPCPTAARFRSSWFAPRRRPPEAAHTHESLIVVGIDRPGLCGPAPGARSEERPRPW